MNQCEVFSRGGALGALGLAAMIFAGCGGDDGGGGGGGNNNANATAPAGLAGKNYDLNDSGGTGTKVISFASPSRYTLQAPGQALEAGTWTGSSDGAAWTVGLTTDAGGSKTLRMNFSGPSSGSYTISRSGLSDETGSFSLRNDPLPDGDNSTGGGDTTTDGGSNTTTDGGSNTTTDGGSNTTTDGSSNTTTDGSNDTTTDGSTSDTSTDGNTDGSATDGTTGQGPSNEYTGNAPLSLHARTLYGTRTFTSTGPTGQTHTYTFSGNMFHDSDPPEESDGVYTYTASNSRASLVLNYNSPAEFANDSHQLDMNFTERDRGTFTSTYVRGDGTTITINGEFYLDPIP